MRTGVLVLAGPTAGGKTDLAIDLARQFNAEIVGADSRQIYRGMDIGTAAPTADQRAAVPHHLIGFLDPHERYSAARFAGDAVQTIEEIQGRGKRVIVVGGTGFYIRALCGGVELAPAYDETLRKRLAHEAHIHDAAFLYEWLRLRDPRRAQAVAAGDTYRVLRALEVALATGGSSARSGALPTLQRAQVPFLKVFLDVDDAVLRERIAQRVDAMLAAGLTEEAERIGAGAVAGDAVGYPQALAFLAGHSTFAELRATLARETRRYAKRQQSWFRREPLTVHLRAGEVESAAREKLAWV